MEAAHTFATTKLGIERVSLAGPAAGPAGQLADVNISLFLLTYFLKISSFIPSFLFNLSKYE